MSDTTTRDPQAAAVLQQFERAISGMQNDWPSTQPSIVFQQVTYTPAAFIAKLQGWAAILQAVPEARSALETALTNRHAAFAGLVEVINGFFTILPQYLPPGADVTKFGAKQKKARAKLTAAQKTTANEKRQATRAARHIMGKKQRLAIKAPAPTAPATTAPAAATSTTPATPAPRTTTG